MNTGIICEFNPFHAGHRYLIEQAKKNGGSVVCIMSGNFVQRGDDAVYDKFKRTRAALEGGADLLSFLQSRRCCPQRALREAQSGLPKALV